MSAHCEDCRRLAAAVLGTFHMMQFPARLAREVGQDPDGINDVFRQYMQTIAEIAEGGDDA